MLRPQDILVVLKIQAFGRDSFANLGLALGISASQAYSAARRAVEAGLLRDDYTVRPHALLQALQAIKYYFPAKRGGIVRGIPTAYAAPPLAGQFMGDNEPPPVWPSGDGTVRGVTCEPLYKTAPAAALRDENLYQLLTLIDALRIGQIREVSAAFVELKRRIEGG